MSASGRLTICTMLGAIAGEVVLSAAKMGDLNPMSAARRAAREGVDLS